MQILALRTLKVLVATKSQTRFLKETGFACVWEEFKRIRHNRHYYS